MTWIKTIYKGKQIEDLNIYEDNQNGMHFDVKVSNSSSRPLKSLLEASPKRIKFLIYRINDST